MNKDRIIELRDFYRDTLLNDILPFWMKHIRDDACGGYLHHIDADGSVISTDKAFWIICRTVWMYATCYAEIERNPEWLDFARHGYEFIDKYGFDGDGRMFYSVTREGIPLRKRRYLFTECFGVMALAAYGHAIGDKRILDRAKQLYKKIIELDKNPDASMPSKFYPARKLKSLSMPMILIGISQVLRRIDNDPFYDSVIDVQMRTILSNHLHHEKRALFEHVQPDGTLTLDIPEGRCINPGHALETAWFILDEGRYRNDDELIKAVLPIVDYSMDLGWDNDYGGILYFVDIEGKPPEQYEHDMKLWWVQLEGLYANLLAYRLTDSRRYFSWFEKLHLYSFDHFPDRVNGEWFGYLHRDGTVANTVKGSKWKGPFHLPRTLLNVWRLLDEMLDYKS